MTMLLRLVQQLDAWQWAVRQVAGPHAATLDVTPVVTSDVTSHQCVRVHKSLLVGLCGVASFLGLAVHTASAQTNVSFGPLQTPVSITAGSAPDFLGITTSVSPPLTVSTGISGDATISFTQFEGIAASGGTGNAIPLVAIIDGEIVAVRDLAGEFQLTTPQVINNEGCLNLTGSQLQQVELTIDRFVLARHLVDGQVTIQLRLGNNDPSTFDDCFFAGRPNLTASGSLQFNGTAASFSVNKSTPAVSYLAGQNLTYDFEIVNSANSVLTGLAISDPLIPGLSCPQSTMEANTTLMCQGTYTVPSPAAPTSITNTVTVSTDQGNENGSHTIYRTDQLTLSATLSADTTPYTSVGNTRLISVLVTNTGLGPLSNLDVDVSVGGSVLAASCPTTDLAPTAATTCSLTYAVTQADLDAGSVSATATVDTLQTTPQTTNTETISATQSPALTAVKSSPLTDYDLVGDVLTYQIVVTNTGNITLTGLVVDDPLTGDEACPATSIAPSNSVTCTASYTVQYADIVNGLVSNTATADTDQTAQISTNTVIINGPTLPSIVATKRALDDRYTAVGDVLAYEIVVTNNGNAVLTGLTIDDPLTDDEACPVSSLAPSASTTCTATYTVTFDDLRNGSVANTAFAASDQTAAVTTNQVIVKFDPSGVRERTKRVISNFMSRRADLITASEPDLTRRLTRKPTGTTPSGLPLVANGTRDNLRFSFATGLQELLKSRSMTQRVNATRANLAGVVVDSKPAETFQGFDIWTRGLWAKSDFEDTEHEFGLIYLGVDYRFEDKVVVGLLGQFDWTKDNDRPQLTRTSGKGWLIGPYIVARLHDNLLFDARIAGGQSYNNVNPIGYYVDDFQTDRMLARARFTGDYSSGHWHVAPHIGVVYFRERQKDYVDSLNIAIPGQTVSLGRLTFGPEFSYRFGRPDWFYLTPSFKLTGIWDFDQANIVDLETGAASEKADIRARVEVGLTGLLTNGVSISGRGFYDGLGNDELESYGGNLAVRVPLQP
ncbi:MAG: autotransporter domain-containing protein [Pseudomonadota bacterium]